MLVNRHFYATAQLVAHRRKTVKYSRDNIEATQKQIQKWLEDPLMLRSIREINVLGPRYPRSSPGHDAISDEDAATKMTAMWAPLVQLVKKASRIAKVEFGYGGAVFPYELLQALETYHPHVKLCIWEYHRDPEMDHTDAAEQALSRSPILRTIRASIWTSNGGTPIDLRLEAFKRIIANAPNLKLASVNQGQSGCLPRLQKPEEEAQEEEAAAKFHAHCPKPNTSVRSLTLDGFHFDEDMLNEWGKFASLRHLEKLKCSRGIPDNSYFKAAPSLLTNLKDVSLNFGNRGEDPELAELVGDYLSSCAPLETLSLWSWMNVVSLDTILKHGPTLKMLQLHERESLSLETKRGLLSLEDIRRIRNDCPQLKDFTFDLDRADINWQKDIELHKTVLEECARFGRRLQRLQIYLDLGVANELAGLGRRRVRRPRGQGPLASSITDMQDGSDGDDDSADTSAEYDYRGPFPPPCTTAEIRQHAEAVWKIVFGDPANKGPRELDIKWGEWERKRAGGYPASWVLWEQREKRQVLVRPHERDDRPGEAVVRVWNEMGRMPE